MYGRVLNLLYVVLIALVALTMFDMAVTAVVILIVTIITLVQKIHFEEEIESDKKKRAEMIDAISAKIDAFSCKVEELHAVVENRMSEFRHDYEVELEKQYRELARKILDVENNLSAVKRTLGAAFSTLDDRLIGIEKPREEYTAE